MREQHGGRVIGFLPLRQLAGRHDGDARDARRLRRRPDLRQLLVFALPRLQEHAHRLLLLRALGGFVGALPHQLRQHGVLPRLLLRDVQLRLRRLRRLRHQRAGAGGTLLHVALEKAVVRVVHQRVAFLVNLHVRLRLGGGSAGRSRRLLPLRLAALLELQADEAVGVVVEQRRLRGAQHSLVRPSQHRHDARVDGHVEQAVVAAEVLQVVAEAGFLARVVQLRVQVFEALAHERRVERRGAEKHIRVAQQQADGAEAAAADAEERDGPRAVGFAQVRHQHAHDEAFVLRRRRVHRPAVAHAREGDGEHVRAQLRRHVTRGEHIQRRLVGLLRARQAPARRQQQQQRPAARRRVVGRRVGVEARRRQRAGDDGHLPRVARVVRHAVERVGVRLVAAPEPVFPRVVLQPRLDGPPHAQTVLLGQRQRRGLRLQHRVKVAVRVAQLPPVAVCTDETREASARYLA